MLGGQVPAVDILCLCCLSRLMLEQTERALDDNVLKDGARRNINGLTLGGNNNDSALEGDATAQVHSTSNGEVVQFENFGDGGDMLLEVGNFLEVTAELDQRRVAEAVGAHLKLTVLESV